mgnify:CR=1 FL=1
MKKKNKGFEKKTGENFNGSVKFEKFFKISRISKRIKLKNIKFMEGFYVGLKKRHYLQK